MLTIYVSILPITMSKLIMGAISVFIQTHTHTVIYYTQDTTIVGYVDKSM